MQFTIPQVQLIHSLQKVIGVVPTKTTIPILSNILLVLKENQLNLTGTDLEISISTEIEVTGQENGEITVPGKIFTEIIRELPSIPISVITEENQRILINTEGGHYKLTGQPREDFPNIVVEEGEGYWKVDSKKMMRMINKTLFAVSSDELRPALLGVYLQIMQDQLRFVATDGHRLVKVIDKDFKSLDFQKALIIPTKALNLLLRNIEEGEKISMRVGENQVFFQSGQTAIYSKLIEGQYPNYERVIPLDNDKVVVANRDLLTASVRRVAIFSNSITHQVRFSLSKNQMEIGSEDVEFGGEGKEIIPVDYQGEEMQIGYNAVYILDILRQIDTEEVVFHIKDPTSAGIIYPSSQRDGEDLMMLIMPIRLNEG